MKRFLSVLLVAMLIVTCLSTVAFAATVVKTGDTQTFTVTVSGDEFTNYGLQLSTDAGLKITKISGVTANVGTGKVGYAGSENITSHSFQVTVEVTATQPGVYNVYATVLQADKMVTVEDENGNPVVKLVPASVSANGASFEIVCDHAWDNGKVTKEATCTEDGVKTFTCSKCGETKTEAIAATGHDWDNGKVTKEPTCTENGVKTYTCSNCGETKTEAIAASHSWETKWTYDEKNHWHECSKCDEIKDQEEHTMILVDAKEPTPEEDGYTLYECAVCDRQSAHKWEYGEEPKVGDIRPLMVLGFGAVLSMLAAAAYVCKRKNVI